MALEIRPDDAPGTYRAETDNTGGGLVPLSSGSVVMVGLAASGPTNQRVRLRSQPDLARIFGIGDVSKYGYEWYAANDFLEESNEIWFVRVSENNATSGSKMAYANLSISSAGVTSTAVIGDMSTSEVMASLLLPTGKGNTPDFILPLETTAAPSNNGFTIAATAPGAENNLIGVELKGSIGVLEADIEAIPAMWPTGQVVALGRYYLDTSNNHLWKVTTAGTLGAEPTWPTTLVIGTTTVTSGSVVLTYTNNTIEGEGYGVYVFNTVDDIVKTEAIDFPEGTAVAYGDLYKDANDNWWKVFVVGTLGAEPTWPTSPVQGQQVTCGTVVFVSTTEIAERDVLGLRNRYPDHWWKMFRLRIVKKSSSSVASFSGLPILDEFYFTLDDSTTGSGESLFIKDVINGKGNQYVYAISSMATGLVNGSFDPSGYDIAYTALASGQDGVFTISSGEYINQVNNGWELYRSREYIEWFTGFDGRTPEIDPAYQVFHKANAIAADRICGKIYGQAGKRTDLRKELVMATSEAAFAGLAEPSRGVMCGGWDKRIDQNTGKVIWLPKSIEGVRAALKTARLKTIADAPSGADVAICKGIEQNVHWKKEDVGYLYSYNINVSWDKPEGNVLWGQKTCQRVESRRNRINVRNILDRVGVDLEQIGDRLVWKTITPKLIERLFSQFDRYLSAKAPTYFDTRKSTGYRLVIDDSKAQENRLDVRVEVLPVGVLEYLGINIIVTDEGAFLQ